MDVLNLEKQDLMIFGRDASRISFTSSTVSNIYKNLKLSRNNFDETLINLFFIFCILCIELIYELIFIF